MKEIVVSWKLPPREMSRQHFRKNNHVYSTCKLIRDLSLTKKFKVFSQTAKN